MIEVKNMHQAWTEAVILQVALWSQPYAREGDGQAAAQGFAEGARGLPRAPFRMTPEALATQLWGGRILAELADRAGGDLQKVRDAVHQACVQAIQGAIEQAVQSGRLTREQADGLLQGLDRGYRNGDPLEAIDPQAHLQRALTRRPTAGAPGSP